jgi:hypothetical protein
MANMSEFYAGWKIVTLCFNYKVKHNIKYENFEISKGWKIVTMCFNYKVKHNTKI